MIKVSRSDEFNKATIFDWHGTLTRSDRSDKPNKKMLKKAEKADDNGDVVVLTSSPDKELVEGWLDKHDVDYDKLIARPKNNKEPDYRVKERLLKSEVEPDYKVTKAYDDKSKNRKMFRKQGIRAEKV